MNGAGSLAVVALLLAAQAAVASPIGVSGTLTTPGALRISPSVAGSAVVGAAFWPDASGMSTLTLQAARLDVYVYEFERIETPLTRQYLINNSRSFDLGDARAALAEPPTGGWVASYAEAQGDDVGLSTRTLVVEPTREAIGNTEDAQAGRVHGRLPLYSYAPDGPYLLGRGASEITRDGAVTLKVFGPTLRLAGAQNDTTYWTGSRPSEKTPGASTVRWLVLTSQEATLHAASSAEAELAIRSASLRTSGEVSARRASGTLQAASGSYVAIGEDAILSGDLEMTLAPSTSDRQPTLEARMSGALASTTLGFARAPVSPTSSPFLFLLGAAGLAIVAAAVVVARGALRSLGPRLTPEQLTDLAYAAGDEGRFDDALEWIQRARELARTSERLKMDEAYFRTKLHDHDGALALFDEVSKRSTTGEADFHAAALMIEMGKPLHEIRPHVLRALERTPLLALEIPEDATFREVRRDPQVARAISSALRKLDSGTADFE